MGQPKLLLPFRDGTVLDAVLGAWTASRVDVVVAVVRADDCELQNACRRWPLEVVCPDEDPADMKASVLVGLRWIEVNCEPSAADACFVSPADLPRIESSVIDRLIDTWLDAERSCDANGKAATDRKAGVDIDANMSVGCDFGSLVMPQFGDRVGHPALFPWPATRMIDELTKDEGIDRIVKRQPKRMVAFPAGKRFSDIDTPEDYRNTIDRDVADCDALPTDE